MLKVEEEKEGNRIVAIANLRVSSHEKYSIKKFLTTRIPTTCYGCPGINSDVCRWARACFQCNLRRYTIPQCPLCHYQFPMLALTEFISKGYSYLLIAINRLTWWPEVTPIITSLQRQLLRLLSTTRLLSLMFPQMT